MIKFIVTTAKEYTRVFNTFDQVTDYIEQVADDKYKGQSWAYLGRPYGIDSETNETIHSPWTVDSVLFRDSYQGSYNYVQYKIERIDFSTGTLVDFEQP